MMSANSAGTEVDRINQNAGLQPVRVHQELLDALDAALGYAELSGGAFDPTVGPLVKLWGIGFPDARVPTEAEIRQALEKVGWRDLAVDRQKSTVFLRRSGMALDLGALAKGYAADAAAAIIRKNRLPGAIIDLGGNIFAYGEKPGKGPWRIGIRNPLDIPGPVLGVLTLKNKTVVSSGGYERYLEAGGMRYHHILSTRSGYPVETGLLSVTIIADRSIDGDGLSTAVFALGYARGAPLIESLPAVDAVFVFEDRRVIATSGCADYFNLTHPAYTAAASP
jgi:thiamine biosynthesis lipoprotein